MTQHAAPPGSAWAEASTLDRCAEAALRGLVALLPPAARGVAIRPSRGLLGEARANLPDGVHERGGWRLTIVGNRLTRAARL